MRIKKLGVVGAGVMGSGITGIAASAGIPVLLLDVPGDEDRNGEPGEGRNQRQGGRRDGEPDDPSEVGAPGSRAVRPERLAFGDGSP
ncbi:MAG: 3-hydroxyacyl-CoA dehydrogenase NAD-binding domain-containing protein, partial [Gemmatimonadota bacterium]